LSDSRRLPVVVMLRIADCPRPEPPEESSDLFKGFVRRMLVKDPTGRMTAAQLIEHPFVASREESQLWSPL
jgi:serine/threonine protein kinase